MIETHRLKTPEEDGGVLIEPSGSRLAPLVRESSTAPARQARLLDATAGELGASLRRRLELGASVVATGHQAEFYHAGVFAKVIVADVLAQRTAGTPLFLTVDSDTLRSRALVVPQRRHQELRRVNIPFSTASRETIAMFEPPAAREHWLDVFAQAATSIDHYEESLLRPFAAAFASGGDSRMDYCDGMARGRAAVEAALNLKPAQELRISQLGQTPEFAAFVAHHIVESRRFAACYNDALAEYRRRLHVRARNRPVSRLRSDSEVTELPFWLCREGSPRRRMFVGQRGGAWTMFADAERVADVRETDLRRWQAAPAWTAALGSWRVLPRALPLSCFARLVLAVLFIHGTGGARYDLMTEAYVRQFWGAELPPLACVSATLRLPLGPRQSSPAELLAARRVARDVRFNPQRHLHNLPAALVENRTRLVAQSNRLRESSPGDRVARRLVFSEIRAVNDSMLRCEPWRVAELDERVATLEHAGELDRIALDREYFYALHPVASMTRLAETVSKSLAPE